MSLLKKLSRPTLLKNSHLFRLSSSLIIALIISLLIFTVTDNSIFNVKVAFGYGEAPGSVDVTPVITNTGIFTQTLTVTSGDNNVEMNIPQGTKGLTSTGQPLVELQVVEMTSPPPPPVDSHIIGIPYDFGPNGATFDPPITISFTYNPDDIPAGVNPADLKIAYYDTSAGTWVTLSNITVDPVTHLISGTTSHFTVFTIIAYTPPITPPTQITGPSEIGINWTLIVGLLAGIFVLTIVLWQYLAHRRD